MKNKKAIVLLLVLTGIIWGLIVYRVIITLSGNTISITRSDKQEIVKSDTAKIDTFSLVKDYRDPFLEYTPERISKSISVPSKPKPPHTPQIVSPFPQASFLGRIQNQALKKRIAIMMIKGRIKSMVEGENYDGLTLLKVMGDSVILSFNKEKRIITKGQINPAKNALNFNKKNRTE
jgi:hypothetical protein